MRTIQQRLNQLQPDNPPQALLIPDSPQPTSQIILFTGSFNPPTSAHLALLKQGQIYAQQHPTTRLYAAFSKRTIDKEGVERPLLLDRISLLRQIVQRRLPETGIILFNRGLYVEQAEAIYQAFPWVQRIFFLMGYDKIVQILDPRYYTDREAALTELFARAELLVAPRGNDGKEALQALLQQPENQRFANSIHMLPLDEHYRHISSTQIRQSSSLNRHAIPHEVQTFIAKTHAYTAPILQPDGKWHDNYAEHIARLSRHIAMPVS